MTATTSDKTIGALTVTDLTPGAAYCFRVRTFTPAHAAQQNAIWSAYTAPLCPGCGDFNGNGVIDLADIIAISERWLQTSSDPGWDSRFDLDGSGVIDMIDIMRVNANWDYHC